MKNNEAFNPLIKSAPLPSGLVFRLADFQDIERICHLQAIRNPEFEALQLLENSKIEVEKSNNNPHHKLFVSELAGQVIGFCRLRHSHGLPESKKIYPSPEGWYGMGIMVDPKFRRQNIARFLFEKRLQYLRGLEATELYSVVDSVNLASMKMHLKFGFTEISRGHGFLHFQFKENPGVLFRIGL